MNRLIVLLALAGSLLAASCATINSRFPAAAAQAAADRVIDQVWGGRQATPPAAASPLAPEPTSALAPARTLALRLLDAVLPPAQAAAEPDLDLSSSEIQRLVESMAARFPDLMPHYQSGAIGQMADGFIVVRDGNRVALPDRKTAPRCTTRSRWAMACRPGRRRSAPSSPSAGSRAPGPGGTCRTAAPGRRRDAQRPSPMSPRGRRIPRQGE
jgi:hypothetical protein